MEEVQGHPVTDVVTGGPSEAVTANEPLKERERAAPIESRFMFVDIAALRAKQLRRGARPRIPTETWDDLESTASPSLKLERIAIAEVESGLIHYQASPESPEDQLATASEQLSIPDEES